MTISFVDLIFMSLMLTTAILILWWTSNSMLEKKKIVIFLPFFVSFLILCFSAGLSFFGVFDQTVWFLLELSWVIIFLWILIIIKKKNDRN